jgi:hypothetical protein
MSKENIPIVGKIIETRIREIDSSTMDNMEGRSLEDMIRHIENLYQFEEDKTHVNRLIDEIRNAHLK